MLKYWRQWCIYRLHESKKRLNNTLADHYRTQRMQGIVIQNLLISNKIFKTVYSEDKINSIYTEKLYMKVMSSLLIHHQSQQSKWDDLPRQHSFYTISALWLEDCTLSMLPGARHKKLRNHFEQKVNETYKIKAMFALREHYKLVKAFRINL